MRERERPRRLALGRARPRGRRDVTNDRAPLRKADPAPGSTIYHRPRQGGVQIALPLHAGEGCGSFGLLGLAAVVLVIALALEGHGLATAANVATLVSILLAIPPLVVPLIALVKADRESSQTPLNVEAEQRDLDWLVRLDDGKLLAASGHSLRLYVQATGDYAVVLQDLNAVVVERQSATGELIENPSLGVMEPRPFDLFLDTDPPALVPRKPGVNFPLKVARDDPEALDVRVNLTRGVVEWYLVLSWRGQGRSGTLRIDAAGKPFRTAGPAGLASL